MSSLRRFPKSALRLFDFGRGMVARVVAIVVLLGSVGLAINLWRLGWEQYAIACLVVYLAASYISAICTEHEALLSATRADAERDAARALAAETQVTALRRRVTDLESLVSTPEGRMNALLGAIDQLRAAVSRERKLVHAGNGSDDTALDLLRRVRELHEALVQRVGARKRRDLDAVVAQANAIGIAEGREVVMDAAALLDGMGLHLDYLRVKLDATWLRMDTPVAGRGS